MILGQNRIRSKLGRPWSLREESGTKGTEGNGKDGRVSSEKKKERRSQSSFRLPDVIATYARRSERLGQ